MGSNFEQMNVFVPGGTPPIPVACRPFDQSHVIVVYKDKSCALMQIDENNEPRYIDELPAVNGAVSSIVAVSENSFITGSQDRTFRGWSVHEEGFETDFNMLSEDIIKCTSINE